jgi:hypothetical protein
MVKKNRICMPLSQLNILNIIRFSWDFNLRGIDLQGHRYLK